MTIQTQPKDPQTAFLIELVGGLFGFLGFGYIYAGYTSDGVVRLLLFMFLIWGGWIVTALLTAILIGLCFIPVMLALQIGVPIWSGSELKKKMLAGVPPQV